MRYALSVALERLPGHSAYFGVHLPADVAQEIDEVSSGLRGGFGSVRVQASIAGLSWRSSIFREAQRSSYLLLVGKRIREQARLNEGDLVQLTIELVDF
ncbi:MAG: DUF1905 domain-containing protein [Actinomycetales bacterium]|nr:DUF1905 domain-containing protein [Actinomycetales bacterium]